MYAKTWQSGNLARKIREIYRPCIGLPVGKSVFVNRKTGSCLKRNRPLGGKVKFKKLSEQSQQAAREVLQYTLQAEIDSSRSIDNVRAVYLAENIRDSFIALETEESQRWDGENERLSDKMTTKKIKFLEDYKANGIYLFKKGNSYPVRNEEKKIFVVNHNPDLAVFVYKDKCKYEVVN